MGFVISPLLSFAIYSAVCCLSASASQDALSGIQELPETPDVGKVETWNVDEGRKPQQAKLDDDEQADVVQFPRGLQNPEDAWPPLQSHSAVYNDHVGEEHLETPVSIMVPSSPMASDPVLPTTQPAAFLKTTQPLISIIHSSSMENGNVVSSFSNKDDSTEHASKQHATDSAPPVWRNVLCTFLVSCGAIGSIITSAFLCNSASKPQRQQEDLNPEEIRRRQLAAKRLNQLLSGEPECDSPTEKSRSRADSIEEGSCDGDGAASPASPLATANFNSSGYEPVRTNSADPA